jgi:hypothetical protein
MGMRDIYLTPRGAFKTLYIATSAPSKIATLGSDMSAGRHHVFIWYSFFRNDRLFDGEGWELFGNPNVGLESEADEGSAADEVSN